MNIILFPNEILKQKSVEIDIKKFDIKYKKLFNEMLDIMYKYDGIGLAAVQIGMLKRILVVDVTKTKNKPIKLANPKIIASKGKKIVEEGCLSVPKKHIKVERFEEIVIEAIDGNGKFGKFLFSGFEAVAVQHEIDHLNGKIILDYA
jgi:peptide deformylase